MKTLLLAGLLLAGYNAKDTGLAADGYRFEDKEFVQTDIEVKVVIHETYKDLHDAAKEHGIKDAKKVKAFSKLVAPYYNVCEIHILDPYRHYAPEYIGHELAHCIYGRWHDHKKESENKSPTLAAKGG